MINEGRGGVRKERGRFCFKLPFSEKLPLQSNIDPIYQRLDATEESEQSKVKKKKKGGEEEKS